MKKILSIISILLVLTCVFLSSCKYGSTLKDESETTEPIIEENDYNY